MHAYVHFWYILKIVLKKSYLRFSFSNFRIKVAANALDREATPNTVELVTFTWWSKSLEPNPREYTTLPSLTTEMARAGLFRHFIVFSIISVISFESALLSARARALVVQMTIKTRKEYPNILVLNVLKIENAHAFFLKVLYLGSPLPPTFVLSDRQRLQSVNPSTRDISQDSLPSSDPIRSLFVYQKISTFLHLVNRYTVHVCSWVTVRTYAASRWGFFFMSVVFICSHDHPISRYLDPNTIYRRKSKYHQHFGWFIW